MRGFEVSSFFAIFALVLCLTTSDAAQDNEDDVLMKNISTLHFQLFTSIQKKTKLIKTAVFETQCSGSGCTFNGCESSGSETCDGQMFTKLNTIQSSISNILKKKKPETMVCKQGWKRYNGHCYHLFNEKMNWFQAQIFCRNQGTTLLQINDANENKWLTENFPNVAYWIDFTDVGMEGKWVTLSTGKNEYSNWDRGQPDKSAGKQHFAINNYGKRLGLWNDGEIALTFQAMCETSGSGF